MVTLRLSKQVLWCLLFPQNTVTQGIIGTILIIIIVKIFKYKNTTSAVRCYDHWEKKAACQTNHTNIYICMSNIYIHNIYIYIYMQTYISGVCFKEHLSKPAP